MAVLKSSDDLALEVTFGLSVERMYIGYKVRFLWKGTVIINPEIIDNASQDFFFGDDYRWDSLIPSLEKSLENSETVYWQTVDPDISIDIKPERGFFTSITAAETDHHSSPRLPEWFILKVQIDSEQFKGSCGIYQSQGIALIIRANRTAMLDFIQQLKVEWEEANQKYSYADLWSSDDAEEE